MPFMKFVVWNLKNAFAESGFLRELFEVLGVRVVVECKVCLEYTQLVMLEGRPKALLSRRRAVTDAVLVTG